jgi:hypothetical protein
MFINPSRGGSQPPVVTPNDVDSSNVEKIETLAIKNRPYTAARSIE